MSGVTVLALSLAAAMAAGAVATGATGAAATLPLAFLVGAPSTARRTHRCRRRGVMSGRAVGVSCRLARPVRWLGLAVLMLRRVVRGRLVGGFNGVLVRQLARARLAGCRAAWRRRRRVLRGCGSGGQLGWVRRSYGWRGGSWRSCLGGRSWRGCLGGRSWRGCLDRSCRGAAGWRTCQFDKRLGAKRIGVIASDQVAPRAQIACVSSAGQ
jgi:hypothetical protein